MVNAEIVLAHAKENYINKKKVEELQSTLEEYENQNKLIEDIIKKNKELQSDTRLYEYIIKRFADKYSIPPSEVTKIIMKNEIDKQSSKQRERDLFNK